MFSRLIILTTFFICVHSYSQEKPLTLTQKMKQDIGSKIAQLKENKPQDWLLALEDLSTLANNYITEQQKECEGEFAVVEFDEEGKPDTKTRILSKSEKRLCLLELLRFRKMYIEEIFSFRKIVVKDEYELRLQRLETQKASLLEEISKISSQIK